MLRTGESWRRVIVVGKEQLDVEEFLVHKVEVFCLHSYWRNWWDESGGEIEEGKERKEGGGDCLLFMHRCRGGEKGGRLRLDPCRKSRSHPHRALKFDSPN